MGHEVEEEQLVDEDLDAPGIEDQQVDAHVEPDRALVQARHPELEEGPAVGGEDLV
jgi:hypothetical protein